MFRLTESVDLSEYTFIVPSISVGNVGQLTCDLLISSYNLIKIGTVWHQAIIPAYGANPFDPTSKDNCVACELYASEQNKFVVLQLRSSIEQRMVNLFLKDLKSFIVQQKFAEILILTSTFSYEMHDVSSGYFRYLTTNSNLGEVLREKKILPLESGQNRMNTVPGSGFAMKLYESLATDSITATVLVKYTSEGDNRPDAVAMFQLTSVCLALKIDGKPRKISFPYSWDLVYGSPPPIGIY